MFTPKVARPLVVMVLVSAGALWGCEGRSLDSPEYGEIIQEVPPELNRPYPLPELNPPQDAPLPGPKETGENSGETPE